MGQTQKEHAIRVQRTLVLVLLVPGLASAQDPPKPAGETASQAPETKPAKPKKRREGVSLEFDRYPSLRVGEVLRMDVRVRLQFDVRHYEPDVETDEGTFEVRRARASIEGWVTRDVEYEFDFELDDLRIRDAYINYRRLRDAQLRIGKFKIPFSLDQLTSPIRLDFIYRSRLGAELAPGRDVGAMLHGRVFQGGLGYQFGYFYGGGERTRDRDDSNTRERTWAARVTSMPLRLLPLPGWAQTAEIGVNATLGDARSGPFSSRLRSISEYQITERYFVKGPRHRIGTDLLWFTGPFSVRGECLHMRVSREEQSLFGTDLPDLIFRGWYLSGSWLLTGEKKAERTDPAKPLLQGGFGAVELATRYEQSRIASTATSGTPLRNPRAANIVRTSDRVWTWGLNWFLNQWSRIQLNWIHENIEDPLRAPIEGRRRYGTFVTRFQFTL